MQRYSVGDRVIYRKAPLNADASAGRQDPNSIVYVEECYRVTAVPSRNIITVRAANGKGRSLRREDPCLRRANLLERLVFADRFPRMRDWPLTKEDFDYAFDWRGAQACDGVG